MIKLSTPLAPFAAKGLSGQWPIRLLPIVYILSAAIAVQGWSERIPITDDAIPIRDAFDFVHHGIVPYRGTMSSLMAYAPPGTTWFWAVGVATSKDPSFLEIPGALLLHACCLAVLFALANMLLGSRWASFWVTTAYAFSALGLRFAISLWPRGHPMFCCLCILLLMLWATRKNEYFFAAAVIMFAAGCYYFLELAPLGIIFLTVAWFARPPVSWRAVALASIGIAAIWLPFLYWDGTHGFKNLKISVTRSSKVNPTDSRIAWCDPHPRFQLVTAQGPGPDFHFDKDFYTVNERIPKSTILRVAKRMAKEFMKCAEGFLANFIYLLPLPFLGAALAGLLA
jgi:hypothetical protein